jgi:hypothetical protein
LSLNQEFDSSYRPHSPLSTQEVAVQTSTTPSLPEAGPVVAPSHPAIHRLVHLTAMHATFTIQSLHDWLLRDSQRQEAGTADSLTYLVNSVRFLMTVADRNNTFAHLCREEKDNREQLIQGLESTFAVLKSIHIDTRDAEAQCRLLRFHTTQLEASAASYDDSLAQIGELFNRLQDRVDAVMRAPGLVATPSRPN